MKLAVIYDLTLITAKERRVVELFGLGHKAKEIGKMLNLSFHTCHSHQFHVKRRLNINTSEQWQDLIDQIQEENAK